MSVCQKLTVALHLQKKKKWGLESSRLTAHLTPQMMCVFDIQFTFDYSNAYL